MSRRCHHGARRHVRPAIKGRTTRVAESTSADAAPENVAQLEVEESVGADLALAAELDAPPVDESATPVPGEPVLGAAEPEAPAAQAPVEAHLALREPEPDPHPHHDGREARFVPPRTPRAVPRPAPVPRAVEQPSAAGEAGPDGARAGCTAPQLRRFIKSRAYVPMHELRRRFDIVGDDDDVTPVDVDGGRVFVGLPEREGRLLGELFRTSDIGYELSFDPITPIVVGVYAIRPIARG